MRHTDDMDDTLPITPALSAADRHAIRTMALAMGIKTSEAYKLFVITDADRASFATIAKLNEKETV